MPCDQPVPGKNRHIRRHLFFVFERVCEERQVTSSIRTPASSLERTIARCAGCFWEIRVTCRPRWGATRAEKRGTRRLGRLPMSNVSRQGEARQDKVANSCISNIRHFAPVDESPAFAETVCGILYHGVVQTSKNYKSVSSKYSLSSSSILPLTYVMMELRTCTEAEPQAGRQRSGLCGGGGSSDRAATPARPGDLSHAAAPVYLG